MANKNSSKPPMDNCTRGSNLQIVTNGSGLLGERFGSFGVEIIGLREHRERDGERERDESRGQREREREIVGPRSPSRNPARWAITLIWGQHFFRRSVLLVIFGGLVWAVPHSGGGCFVSKLSVREKPVHKPSRPDLRSDSAPYHSFCYAVLLFDGFGLPWAAPPT